MEKKEKPVPPFNFGNIPPEERAEYGRQGGLKSGEAKRRKKAMKESLEILLDMKIKGGKECDIEAVKNFAELKGKNITVEQAMLIAQIHRALKGDTTALTFIRDTSGQAPNQKVDITGAVPVVISGEEKLED